MEGEKTKKINKDVNKDQGTTHPPETPKATVKTRAYCGKKKSRATNTHLCYRQNKCHKSASYT